MAGFAFVILDDSPEPEWQVRVDQIAGFCPAEDGVEVLTVSGKVLYGSLTVPQLMARMQSALARIDGA